jgi:hypothetical protein
MRNNPLSSMVADSADRLFVTDKSGKIVFFPWGSKKQGYSIKNKNLAAKVKKFYTTSFFVCLFLLIIPLLFFDKNIWGIIGSMIICFGGWYLAYFLYVSRVVKSLQPAKASFKELILASYESDDSESEDVQEPTETQFPARWSMPFSQANNDPLFGIKRIWYWLSPGPLMILYIVIGIIIIIVSVNLIKHEFGESPVDFLIAFVVSVLWGLAGFVAAKNMEVEKKDWWGLLTWKAPVILITVACWSFSAFSLYKFFYMLFV